MSPLGTRPTDERIARAFEMAGGNRLKAASILARWSATISGTDAELSKDLNKTARTLTRRDYQQGGNALSRNGRKDKLWRLRGAQR